MNGKGVKYEKANDVENSDIELPLATADTTVIYGNDNDDGSNLVTVIFEKPSKDCNLGMIWDIVNNEIVLAGFCKTGLAISQANDLEVGMTLISVNGVSFVSGIATGAEDVFVDEEEGGPSSSMGLVTEDTVIEATNIMKNAEGTLTIVARKNPKKNPKKSQRARTTRRTKKTRAKMAKKIPRCSPPPPGAPEGGVWGSTLHFGLGSQISALLCCLFGGLFPAFIMCCFPFDKRRVYYADHRYYNEYGEVIGVEGDLKFKQEDLFRSTYDSKAATTSCCIAFFIVLFTIVMMVMLQSTQGSQSGYYHH